MAFWDSLERMDATFHRARLVAIVFTCLALIAWLLPLPFVTVPAAIVANVAILIALFTWFRREDLARSQRG